ncbi:MAG TPA: spore protease YyaC [Firmicutes bacterium]|nr:spore protease YyaC [Bacillota bacterium]
MSLTFDTKHFPIIRRQTSIKIDSKDPDAVRKLRLNLSSLLKERFRETEQNLVVLCIGTDRSTGDSLGPLTGTSLKRRLPLLPLFGTLEDPVHAVNLAAKIAAIKVMVKNPFIVAVDACLGEIDSVGDIDIGADPLMPGAGVNKSLPVVGDLYVSGIVNVGGFLEHFVLQNTRLSVVVKLSEIITEGLFAVFSPLIEAKKVCPIKKSGVY